jgi:hypothetical protein
MTGETEVNNKYSQNTKGEDVTVEDLQVNGKIILKYILHKWGMRWTGFTGWNIVQRGTFKYCN